MTVKEEGKSATQIENEHRQAMLAKEITVRCMDCPDEEWTGPAREAREQWAIHRRDEHDDESAMASVERMDRELTTKDLRTPANGHKLTREFVIAAVRRFVREHGRAPRSMEWSQSRDKRGDYPSYAAVLRVFPMGWRAMLEAAGVDPAPPATQISLPDVASSAADLRRSHEASPNGDAGVSGGETSSEVGKPEDPLARIRAIPDRAIEEEATVDDVRSCKRDGCDGEPLDRRGLYAGLCAEHKRAAQDDRRSVRKTSVYWTDELIIEAIRQYAARNGGEPPSLRDWKKAGDDYPAADTVIERFGSWNAAIVAAGLTPRRPGDGKQGGDESTSPLGLLAERVEAISATRRSMLEELDELETELREAVDALEAALAEHRLQEAA